MKRMLAILGLFAITAGPLAHAAQYNLVGPTGSVAFGTTVTVLSNGNFVVTDPGYGTNDPVKIGAVFLYDGATLELISTLTGSTGADQVGSGGVTALANGNYVVCSPSWHNGDQASAGAVTWGSGTTGVTGVVSAANSLVGSTEDDQVGSGGVTALSNGNYVVLSPNWANGTATNAGAVTWCSGTNGMTGVVSAANSLVGGTANDQVGASYNGGVTVLNNGNYVVCSCSWNNGAATNAGAVTWCSGMVGVTGAVSAANSLVGGTENDSVGGSPGGGKFGGGVTALVNGNYVVRSPFWDYDAGWQRGKGAATWCSGTVGMTGTVSAANSLVGTNVLDMVGVFVTVLNNGNYVVCSPSWGNSENLGAVTWGSGTAGVHGAVSAANSLVGTNVLDQVGGNVTALNNGNYVVVSPYWGCNNVYANSRGAATWGSGTAGVTGAVSAANSLVGNNGDYVGYGGVTALINGNYVVCSPYWSTNVGAVTWGNGANGNVTGAVSAANSLVGSTEGDDVGSSGGRVTALSNGNYVVGSDFWHNGTVANAGAVTWGNGTIGMTGVVSAANSLVGSTANDNVGNDVVALNNGNYVVTSPDWANGAATNAGAATWGSGTAGVTGAVSAANSLVGSTAGDQIGDYGVMALANGNYVVSSPDWASGGVVGNGKGAVTWGSGTNGMTGAVSAANSLVGSTAGDQVGDGFDYFDYMMALANGNYMVVSPNWANNGTNAAGAVTLGNGAYGTAGVVASANSLVGNVENGGYDMSFAFDPVYNRLVVGYPDGNYVILPSSGPTPPTITVQPISAVVGLGQTASLSVSNDGTGPFGYQWLKDGVILAGQTNSTLAYAAFQFTNSGSYYVVITNAYGMAISFPASLSVSNAPLQAWGYNGYGQLGNGNNTDTNLPITVANNVVATAAGNGHSLFLKSDGTLWAMGQNNFGQLGNGTNVNTNLPIQVTSNVVAVAGGYEHSLFVKSNGTLWAMGCNDDGELGIGTNDLHVHSLPIQVTNNVVAVAAGGGHSLFVKSDGTLWAMGENNYGQLGIGNNTGTNLPTQVTNGVGVVAVAAGYEHSLFVKSDGGLWAMGLNNYGQLGNGTNGAGVYTNRPIQVTNNVVAGAAGAYHSLFVKTDGSLWAMGYNSNGQLGNGTTTDTNQPIQVTNNVVAVAGGGEHSLFMKSDGTLWAMGYNSDGELGNGTYTDTNRPVMVNGGGLMAASLAKQSLSYHSLAIATLESAAPGLQILGTNGVAIASGEVASAAKGTDFGTFTLGAASVTNTFAVTNSGNATLTISGVTTNGSTLFQCSSIPVAIAAGTASNFAIVFNPSAAGVATASVVIVNNSTNTPYVVNLRGVVESAPTPNGWLAIQVTPVSGTWQLTAPAGYTGQTAGTGNLAAVSAVTGQYAVSYGTLSGYVAPSNQSQFVTGGNTTLFVGMYLQISTNIGTPTGVSATQGSYTNKIRATWLGVAGATGYEVWRSQINDPATAGRIADMPMGNPLLLKSGNTYTYYDCAVSPILSYYYWVRAKTGTLISPMSYVGMGYAALSPDQATGTADIAVSDMVFLPVNATNLSHAGTVSCRLANLGPDALNASGVAFDFYMGSNAAAMVWIGSVQSNMTLAMGQEQLVILTLSAKNGLTVREDLSGVQQVQVVVRHLSTLNDPNLANNTTTAAGTVKIKTSGVNSPGRALNDYDGDGKSDLALWHTGSDLWALCLSGQRYQSITNQYLDVIGDRPVPGDYDGDGLTDKAIYCHLNGWWNVLLSSNEQIEREYFIGGPGFTAAQCDFDGDSKTDPMVYREADGYWLGAASSRQYAPYDGFLGGTGSQQVVADYDGDGLADPAVYNRTTGLWEISRSGTGYQVVTGTFGGSGYLPATADYDGDGLADPAIYAPGTAHLQVLLSGSLATQGCYTWCDGVLATIGGTSVLADYDGDGLADPAVYHQDTGLWELYPSTQGYQLCWGLFGGPEYQPVTE